MKKILFLLLISVTVLKGQNYGRIIINSKVNQPFMVSFNGVRLSNQYVLTNTFEYLDESNYIVKVYFAGFPSPINFNLSSSLGYQSVYSIEKDNLGAYALTLESKIKFTALPPSSGTFVATNTIVPTNTTVVITKTAQPLPNDKDYKSFIASLQEEHFDDGRTEKAKSFFKDLSMTSDQAKAILKNFTWDDGKIDFSKFAYPKVTDKQNFYKTYDVYSFTSSKKEVQEWVKKQ